MRKFKPTCLWHRLNQKEWTKRRLQACFVPGQTFAVIWVRTGHTHGKGMDQAELQHLVQNTSTCAQCFPKAQVYCSTQCPNTHEKWQCSFVAAMQGRSLFTLALTLNPPGSSGLSLPDKLWARMWSLGAAPNPSLKSLLLAHCCLTSTACDGWLATAWSLTEEIRYLSKMRGFNLVSGRNPAVGGIKHRLNNPNNSFWP